MKFMPRGLLIGGAAGYAVDYIFTTYQRRRLAYAEEYRAKHPEDFEEIGKSMSLLRVYLVRYLTL